jgi:hypothetical protein
VSFLRVLGDFLKTTLGTTPIHHHNPTPFSLSKTHRRGVLKVGDSFFGKPSFNGRSVRRLGMHTGGALQNRITRFFAQRLPSTPYLHLAKQVKVGPFDLPEEAARGFDLKVLEFTTLAGFAGAGA